MLRRFAPVVLLFAMVSQATAAPDHRVVVITIDGFPAYLLDDPQASLPVLRGLRDSGVAAAGGMRVSNPSVTWPNHTTLMTGVHPEQHGVLFNGVLERGGRGMPVRVVSAKDQQDLVRVPLLFDVLKQAGRTSAAINWPCTRGSTALEDNFPDVPESLRSTTPRLKEELAQKGLLQRFERGGGVVRDEVWTEAACQVIRARKPQLLVLHLLNLDSTHHNYGPRSGPGYTASALTDALVGRVLHALDEAGVRDRTTVFVVADHGFAAVTKTLRPNAVLRREGFLTAEGNRVTSARVMVVPEGGIGMVYLTDPETAGRDREAVRRLFQHEEGIAAVLEANAFDRLHLPQPSGHPGMADLILAAKDGYAISGEVTGDRFLVPNEHTTGAHGYLSSETKMNALFLASGAGITKAPTEIGTIDNIDVAPTVARLLGVSLNPVSGRVLTEILNDRY
jgi:predicted AlkP superfamily pyrophosphatase or phosphodiesterase